MRAIIAAAALVIGTGTSFAAIAQTATATHRGGTAATVSASPSGVNANTATTMRHDNRIETTRTAPMPGPMPGTPSTDPLRARNAIDADGYAGARITGNSVSAQAGATGSAASALNSTGRSTIDPMAPAMAGAGGRLPGL